MEARDAVYALFWPFAVAFALFFLGFGEKAVFLFSLSIVGAVFADRMEKAHYAIGAVLLALAFAAYFSRSLIFISQSFIASLLFLIFPFVFLELRKNLRK